MNCLRFGDGQDGAGGGPQPGATCWFPLDFFFDSWVIYKCQFPNVWRFSRCLFGIGF